MNDNHVAEKIPVLLDGDALKLPLNRSLKLDLIQENYNFHAKGKIRLLQIIY